jgi:hypothetical protein
MSFRACYCSFTTSCPSKVGKTASQHDDLILEDPNFKKREIQLPETVDAKSALVSKAMESRVAMITAGTRSWN